MVNADRDKPQLPSEAELAALRAIPVVARFLDDESAAGPSSATGAGGG